jgi:S1-C subfamily serine protease
MVLYAAGTNQEAIDDDAGTGHGLFTSVLLREMQTEGIDIRVLISTVRAEVAKAAALLGRRQTPALYDEATATGFQLTPGSGGPVAPAVTARAPAADPISPDTRSTHIGWPGMSVAAILGGRGIRVGSRKNVQVVAVDDKGPAAKAGIRSGDVILNFAGKDVDDPVGLGRLAEGARGTRQVAIRIWRGNNEITNILETPGPAPPRKPKERSRLRARSEGPTIWQ